MLVLCPDCKKQISHDVDVCPRCGCNIAKKREEEYIFEEPMIQHYSKLGIVSAAMVPSFLFFWTLLGTIGCSGGAYTAFFVSYMILQICMGAYPLCTDSKAYKWPSIVGIAVPSFVILCIIYLIE